MEKEKVTISDIAAQADDAAKEREDSLNSEIKEAKKQEKHNKEIKAVKKEDFNGALNQNKVTLTGFISRITVKDGFTAFTLNVNKTGRRTIDTTMNFPSILCFGEAKAMADAFKAKDKVRVIGHFQSRKKTDPETGKSYYDQTIVAETIEEAKTELEKEFGIRSGFVKTDENTVAIAGVVTVAQLVSRSLMRFTVRTEQHSDDDKKHYSYVMCCYYDADMSEASKHIYSGAKIAAIGEVQTSRKEQKGKYKLYQNVVLYNIAHII